MLDVFIIGSGPAGLSAALYAKRAKLKLAITDKMFRGVGQIADSSRVDNYLGINGIPGYDLGEKFRKHVEEFGVDFLEEEVIRLVKLHDYWKVYFESGNDITTKTVIFAGGCKYRSLGISDEEKFIGRGISYCATCDGALYKNKTVAVIGGGNTALDEALYLSDICSKVYLIHRRSEFRGSAITLSKIEGRDNIEIIKNATVEKINGSKKIEEIVLQNEQHIKLDGIFLAIGMIPQTEILQEFGITDESGYVNSDENCTTSVEGLFVAGDARTKKLRQIVTAVSDGANAVAAILDALNK